MPALLFKVTDSFKVPGRGVVMIPDISWPGPPPFDQGHTVELRTPKGSPTRQPILYIGHLTTTNTKSPLPLGVMIPESAAVTNGTEVWSCD